MFCGNCGNNLPDDAKFCGACGVKVEAPPAYASPAQMPPSPQPVYVPPPVHAPPVQMPPPRPQALAAAEAPLSVGQYLVTFLLMGIPLLNVILLLVWSLSSSTNANKRNLARAMLIMAIVMFIFWIIAGASMGGMLSEILREMGGY